MTSEHQMPWIDGSSFYFDDMFCMFCGQKVQDQERIDSGDWLHPCKHVLFVATDNGFEYCSPRLRRVFGWDEADVEAFSSDPATYTTSVTGHIPISGAFQVVIDVRIPGHVTAYVGFAPDSDD